jgi:hypothetical protein
METLSLNLANQAGAFSDKNAGSNKVVNVTGATVTDGTGLVSSHAFSNASGVRADIGKASISAIAGIVAGISLSGTDAGNYVVNTSASASATATISQAALTVKVDNTEKDQGRVNPDFSAGYSGLLGGDTVAAEVSGNLAFGTPATTASVAGNYLVSASGQPAATQGAARGREG